jgi:hypothetical protein
VSIRLSESGDQNAHGVNRQEIHSSGSVGFLFAKKQAAALQSAQRNRYFGWRWRAATVPGRSIPSAAAACDLIRVAATGRVKARKFTRRPGRVIGVMLIVTGMWVKEPTVVKALFRSSNSLPHSTMQKENPHRIKMLAHA